MPDTSDRALHSTVLIVGASRGLGCGMAAEYVKLGWKVIGTVRDGHRTDLHRLAGDHQGQVEIETLDVDDQGQIDALRQRLGHRTLDTLFVTAGITAPDEQATIGNVTADDFTRVMVTNALGPMRVIETLRDLVPDDGLIGAMSSGQGSIANNDEGAHELYRGSKAALNMFMKSFAARKENRGRATVLMAPGWTRTGVGGSGAPAGVDDVVPSVVSVLVAERGRPGLRFLDRNRNIVPW